MNVLSYVLKDHVHPRRGGETQRCGETVHLMKRNFLMLPDIQGRALRLKCAVTCWCLDSHVDAET